MGQGVLEICRPSQTTTAVVASDVTALELCDLLKVYNPGKASAVNWLISVTTSSQHNRNKPFSTPQLQDLQRWVPSESGLHTTCKARLGIQGPCPPSTEDLCSGVASEHRREDREAEVMVAIPPSPSLWLGSLLRGLKSQHVSPSLSFTFFSFFSSGSRSLRTRAFKSNCVYSQSLTHHGSTYDSST